MGVKLLIALSFAHYERRTQKAACTTFLIYLVPGGCWACTLSTWVNSGTSLQGKNETTRMRVSINKSLAHKSKDMKRKTKSLDHFKRNLEVLRIGGVAPLTPFLYVLIKYQQHWTQRKLSCSDGFVSDSETWVLPSTKRGHLEEAGVIL